MPIETAATIPTCPDRREAEMFVVLVKFAAMEQPGSLLDRGCGFRSSV
jgi:hypothetical protein